MNESITATLARAAERAREAPAELARALEAIESEIEAYTGDKRARPYRMLVERADEVRAEIESATSDADRLERLAVVLGRMAAKPAVRVKTMGIPTHMTRIQAEGLRWAVQNSDPYIGGELVERAAADG